MALRNFTVGIAQMSPRLGHVEENLAMYEAAVREARGRGVDLVVLPELSLTGYVLRDLVSAVSLRADADEMRRLAELSRQVALVAGIVEETNDGRLFNTALFFEGGEIKSAHRKVYLPTYGMFDEQRYFGRGNQVRAFDTGFGRLAMLVCEDLWHPSTAYLAALDGATIIICPSASPLRGISEGAQADDNARNWELLNEFYARTYGLFLVYANRVGFEDGVGFWGGSEVVDPFGKRLAKARYYDPDFIVAEISQHVARRKRLMAPVLRDEDLDLTINELVRLRGRPAEHASGDEGSRAGGSTVGAARKPSRRARAGMRKKPTTPKHARVRKRTTAPKRATSGVKRAAGGRRRRR
jgi:NAD+ synthase (glutamine-hydrolysing)